MAEKFVYGNRRVMLTHDPKMNTVRHFEVDSNKQIKTSKYLHYYSIFQIYYSKLDRDHRIIYQFF